MKAKVTFEIDIDFSDFPEATDEDIKNIVRHNVSEQLVITSSDIEVELIKE